MNSFLQCGPYKPEWMMKNTPTQVHKLSTETAVQSVSIIHGLAVAYRISYEYVPMKYNERLGLVRPQMYKVNLSIFAPDVPDYDDWEGLPTRAHMSMSQARLFAYRKLDMGIEFMMSRAREIACQWGNT